MKLIFLWLLLILGQYTPVAAQKNEITEVVFLALENRAEELLGQSSYRMIRKLEHFDDRDKPGTQEKRLLKEVLQRDRWRTVEERLIDGKTSREERLWDGKSLFVRVDDSPWQKYSGGSSMDGRIESGQTTTRYRSLGRSELNVKPVDVYESEALRIANKVTMNDYQVVRYVRRTRVWYASDGRQVQKIEENAIEGREEMNRETTTIEYDPNIKIEAPILKL